MNAIWARKRIGSTASAAKVAASTMPALVMTPPVTARPARMPGRVAPPGGLLPDPGHEEDRVVDAERDEEDEPVERRSSGPTRGSRGRG